MIVLGGMLLKGCLQVDRLSSSRLKRAGIDPIFEHICHMFKSVTWKPCLLSALRVRGTLIMSCLSWKGSFDRATVFVFGTPCVICVLQATAHDKGFLIIDGEAFTRCIWVLLTVSVPWRYFCLEQFCMNSDGRRECLCSLFTWWYLGINEIHSNPLSHVSVSVNTFRRV